MAASEGNSARMRRQVLQGMLDENVDLLQDQPLGTVRRGRMLRRARLRRLGALGGGVAAVVALVLWIGSGVGATPDGSAAVTPGASSPPHPGTIQRTDPSERLARLLNGRGGAPLLPHAIPLAVRRVVLDPGHGGRDGGTSLAYGLTEKEITLDIALRLGRLLEAAGLEAVMTRSDDEGVSLRRRAAIANEAHADLFLSIHVNWLPNRDARGVETYFLGETEDPFVNRLAAAENRDSGFSVADYRSLLEGIYADVRHDESRHLATTIQHSLYETLRQANRQLD